MPEPRTFVLKETLFFIWTLIDGRRGFPEILDELLLSLDFTEGDGILELKRSLSYLRQENLIFWEAR
jgi:hypothetical protein